MASDRKLRWCAPVLAALLSFAATAHADPTAADKETARSLMADGRAARDNHDLKGALRSFQAADAIMGVPTTGFEVAKTQAALGLLVEARDTALRVMLRSPEQPGEPQPFKDARNNAQELNEELEGRIPSLKVIVKGLAEDATPMVTIDDARIAPQALAAPRKLNPGHHVVVARAGSAQQMAEVGVAEKEYKEVTLELLPSSQQPSTQRSGTSRALMFGGFGLAGVGAIVGTITGGMSMSKTSSLKNNCPNNQCPPLTYSDFDQAHTMATISTLAFFAAGVGAAVGVGSLILGKSSETSAAPATQARVEPWIGVGTAGVRGAF
jgi:hypothetical protein